MCQTWAFTWGRDHGRYYQPRGYSQDERAHVKNGKDSHTPTPVLPGSIQAVRLIPREHSLAQAELDNLDSAIAELDAALAERVAAAAMYDDIDRRVRVAEERCRLLRLAVQVHVAPASVTVTV